MDYCPIPIKDNFYSIDWIKYIWKHENVYNKLYCSLLKKILLLSSPYGHTGLMLYLEILILNRLLLSSCKLFDDMRYYNVAFRILCKILVHDLYKFHEKTLDGFQLETVAWRFDGNLYRYFQQTIYKACFYRIGYEKHPCYSHYG